MQNRRQFLSTCLAGGVVLAARPVLRAWPGRTLSAAGEAGTAWERLPEILGRIKAPVFPDRDFNVTKFGAIGDDHTDCTDAFRKAIAACSAAGGGRVVVPAGEFMTGAVQ